MLQRERQTILEHENISYSSERHRMDEEWGNRPDGVPS
jgi:hypothetical protein